MEEHTRQRRSRASWRSPWDANHQVRRSTLLSLIFCSTFAGALYRDAMQHPLFGRSGHRAARPRDGQCRVRAWRDRKDARAFVGAHWHGRDGGGPGLRHWPV